MWSLPVTHTDAQVLQEELQQAGAQAKRPRPLVAPRGLDPWAQVLGKRGASHRCQLGACAPQSGQCPYQATLPSFGGQRAGSEWVNTAAAHPCPVSVLLAWITHMGTPGGPRASQATTCPPSHLNGPRRSEGHVWGTCRSLHPSTMKRREHGNRLQAPSG